MTADRFPTGDLAPITESVGYLELECSVVAKWVAYGLEEGGERWTSRKVAGVDCNEALRELLPLATISATRYLLIPAQRWTVLLNNAKSGTDLGMLPSLATRKFGCRSIRAVAIEQRRDRYGAIILEFYDPSGEEPVKCRRVVSAANDGGRWRFDQFGEPLAFEDVASYGQRRIRDRFTPEMLQRYLTGLGVPGRSAIEEGIGNSVFLEGVDDAR